MSETPKCSATTKTGKPCKARPLKDSTTCLAHADATTRESVGFIAANGKAGRPRKPHAIELLKERMEADLDVVLRPLFDALDATRHVVVGNGPTAHVEEVPDLPTQIAAARELLDRGYGKAKQSTEVTGANGGAITFAQLAADVAAE